VRISFIVRAVVWGVLACLPRNCLMLYGEEGDAIMGSLAEQDFFWRNMLIVCALRLSPG